MDVDKLWLAFFFGATMVFWLPLLGIEISTWQSLEGMVGFGATTAVLYAVALPAYREFAEHNGWDAERWDVELTPEEVEYREGLEEAARKKTQRK